MMHDANRNPYPCGDDARIQDSLPHWGMYISLVSHPFVNQLCRKPTRTQIVAAAGVPKRLDHPTRGYHFSFRNTMLPCRIGWRRESSETVSCVRFLPCSFHMVYPCWWRTPGSPVPATQRFASLPIFTPIPRRIKPIVIFLIAPLAPMMMLPAALAKGDLLLRTTIR